MTNENPYRLPTTLTPGAYRLELEPWAIDGGFRGSVEIDVVADTDVTDVVCNNDGLTITAASVVSAGAQTDLDPAAITIDAEAERMTVPVTLPAGEHTLRFSFEGPFNDQLVGFYESTFTGADGEEQRLATTQFEATHARKSFPCWDEPAFKATFEIAITAPEGMVAVSNAAEVARDAADNGATTFRFAPTMVMSTYLVAYVIGDLEITDPVDVDGVPLRIVHVPGKGHLTDFALEAGAFALRYFAGYFDIPYPGDKVDMLAIPDFAFGAMENLGCITFREVLLLIDPDSATQPELQRAADVINHELAHMWFGDLVTMEWWNGLWLNEAFATFMEMRCTDAFRPDWQRWVDFGLSRTAAFDTDALGNTRPIEFDVISPEDAEGMFDILTYEKGAAVVRMLEQHLGEDRFRAGIRRYMRDNAYGNAETTDLWDAIEAETGDPVRRIMDSWIFQGGVPLIHCAIDGDAVVLTQERLRYEGGDVTDEMVDDAVWAVPLAVRVATLDGAITEHRVLLEDEPISITGTGGVDWAVVNAEGASFVRAAYAPDQLDRLAEVASTHLSAVERYALIDDAWSSVLAGTTSAAAFSNLIEASVDERDRSVWQRLIGGFRSLDRLASGNAAAEEAMAAIVRDAIRPTLTELGPVKNDDDEDDRTTQLRGDLFQAMGTMGDDPDVIDQAKQLAADGRRGASEIDAAVLAAAVGITAAKADEVDFVDMMAAWRSAATPQDEIRYLYALAEFADDQLLARVRQLILDGDIRSQNGPYVIRALLANPAGAEPTWAFVKERWDELISMFPSSGIVRMLDGLSTIDSQDTADDAVTFFDRHPVPQGAKTLAQILERQRVAVALRNREHARFCGVIAPD